MTSTKPRSVLTPEDARSISSEASSPPPLGPIPAWRRLLFPGNASVPRIFASDQLSEACDQEVYELLALICREHILPWYSRLTKDRTFLQRVVQIIVHVLREVESRAADADLVQLLAVELPLLLTRHIEDSRRARALEGTMHASGLGYVQLFNSFQPHVGIDVGKAGGKLGIVDAAYLSALVEGILGLSLPAEDNSAEAERAIVREVIIYIILAGAFGKISQPWFIHQHVVREVARQRDRRVPAATSRPAWLSMLSGVITLVTFAAQIFSFVVDSIVAQAWKDSPRTVDLSQPLLELSATLCRTKERPLADQAFWLLRGGAAVFGGTCDSLVREFLSKRVFQPELMRTVLASAKASLFPGGQAAPHVPDPDTEEQAVLNTAAYAAVGALLPEQLLALLMPSVDSAKRQQPFSAAVLDAFDTAEVNVHLLLSLVDLLIARLYPELLAQT